LDISSNFNRGELSIPANLNPEAQLAWSKYQDARTLDDRIEKLELFLSAVNKHKGNEKLIAVNKTRLAKLKAERDAEEQRRKSLSSHKEDAFSVKREPQTPQIMLLSDFFDIEQGGGVGKSTLLRNLTGVSEVYPGIFTSEPVVGTYTWEKVKFQFVEIPALHEATYLSKALGIVRTCDIVALLIDLSRDPLAQMERILNLLRERSIILNRKPPNIKIEKAGGGGIQIFYMIKAAEQDENTSEFIREMAKASGLSNAVIKVYEKLTDFDLELAFNRSTAFCDAIIIATKADVPGSKQNFEKLKEQFELDPNFPNHPTKRFEIFPVAIRKNEEGAEIRNGLEQLGAVLLRKLDYIRVYTKNKKGVADRPLILPRGCTIGDVAMKIHKDLFETFKFAFIYRETGLQKKIRAGLNFPVEDFDVIEIFSAI
jgi:ribosome-interacting GTPase 1